MRLDEAELRTPLLNRTTRRVTPTEARRVYYGRAVRLLDDIAAADATDRALRRDTLRGDRQAAAEAATPPVKALAGLDC